MDIQTIIAASNGTDDGGKSVRPLQKISAYLSHHFANRIDAQLHQGLLRVTCETDGIRTDFSLSLVVHPHSRRSLLPSYQHLSQLPCSCQPS